MLLVAAICAVLFHGAFSAPSPNVDDQPRDTADDNEETDENPILIWAARLFIKVSYGFYFDVPNEFKIDTA